jgi:hypothetical protein
MHVSACTTSAHGHASRSLRGPFTTMSTRTQGTWAAKSRALSSAAAVVTVSNSTAEALRALRPDVHAPVLAGRNGVDTTMFRP